MKSSSLNYPEGYRATPRPIVIDSSGRRFGLGEVLAEVTLGFLFYCDYRSIVL